MTLLMSELPSYIALIVISIVKHIDLKILHVAHCLLKSYQDKKVKIRRGTRLLIFIDSFLSKLDKNLIVCIYYNNLMKIYVRVCTYTYIYMYSWVEIEAMSQSK